MAIETRRAFLTIAGASALGLGCANAADPGEPRSSLHYDDEVTPVEDLMREHGALRRIMYLYDEAAARPGDFPLDALAHCAQIVRRFVEDYHERLEEQQVFPRFERAHELDRLTAVLRQQHQFGRGLTDQILAILKPPVTAIDHAQLARVLQRFNHMYRAHAAREDTVLFPVLRGIIGAAEYAGLGERFEDIEHQTLGDRGYEGVIAEIGELERAFGVADLAKL